MVHDHFDGSQRCVECGGPCKLEGAERYLTEMVRWAFEGRALAKIHGQKGGGLSMMEGYTLHKAGVDIDAFHARAMESMSRILEKRR